jgi:hypothetical protein
MTFVTRAESSFLNQNPRFQSLARFYFRDKQRVTVADFHETQIACPENQVKATSNHHQPKVNLQKGLQHFLAS